MKECDICGKKMPHHVLEAHKLKRHTVEAGDVLTPLPEPDDFVDKSVHNETKIACDCPCQKKEVCASCGVELPAIVMFAHAHIVHGVS